MWEKRGMEGGGGQPHVVDKGLQASAYLAIQLQLGLFTGDGEQCHHATMNVVCEVAVEEPGAGVVCVSIKYHEAAGLDNSLIHVVPVVVKDNAVPVSSVNGVLTAQGAHIPPNPVAGGLSSSCRQHFIQVCTYNWHSGGLWV